MIIRDWTVPSRIRLKEECDALALQFKNATALEDKALIGGRLNERHRLYLETRDAPAPSQTEWVALGHAVEIKYLDEHVSKIRGDTETLIHGGVDEHDDDSLVRTYSACSVLCRAIRGGMVGDTVDVELPHDRTYGIEIMSISVPTTEQLAPKTPKALSAVTASAPAQHPLH